VWGRANNEKGKRNESSTFLDLDLLALLLGQASELLEHLGELLIIFLLALASSLGGNHDHTGGALGSGRGTELGAGGDEDVGDTVVLAENGNVGDDIHGGDVGSEDDNTAGDGDGSVGSGDGGLAESLDDLLDTTLERLVDGG
jgi:hypothetical protein